jgi:thermostable 8-oxoguanine DNA glycosylase
MRTIYDIRPSKEDLENTLYNYQLSLTSKLDSLDADFNQEIINEIVLWKINRYAAIDQETFALINQIKKSDTEIKHDLVGSIFLKLLGRDQKGIRLAIASTILRFKNPKVYQIIDQRVYRFLYGKELNYSVNDINEQICLYLDYLEKLKEVCRDCNIDFEIADRVLYTMDKIYNPDEKLTGY